MSWALSSAWRDQNRSKLLGADQIHPLRPLAQKPVMGFEAGDCFTGNGDAQVALELVGAVGHIIPPTFAVGAPAS
jgi:hypothetical protein